MKKCVFVILLLALLLLTSCANYSIIDTVYLFNYALVKFPDGTCDTIQISSWRDYEGEQIQITATDGTVYVFNSVNCVLVKSK